MMNRRTFIGQVAGSLVAVPFATDAQQAARLPRIAILLPGNTGTGTEDLREGLRELGYVDGRTAVIEWRWWERKPERLRDAAAEVVRLNPDVIVVTGSEATKSMKDATRSIPIVFSGPSYPVEEGLVASFARPGGNITGITNAQSDHVAKLLQLMLDVVPGLSDISVIWSPANVGSTLTLKDLETAARGLKLKLMAAAMASDADVEPALVAVARAHPGALIVLPSPVPIANAERIAELAIRLRVPSIAAQRSMMERGLLMSYGADFRDVQRRIPSYVDRMLKGAKPADIPIERPTKFELGINIKTAKAIGLAIPNSLLLRADAVQQ